MAVMLALLVAELVLAELAELFAAVCSKFDCICM